MAKKSNRESTEHYFLKILLYFLLGLVWVRYNGITIFPLGFVFGFMLAQKEHFQIDRKLELVVLLVGSVIGYMNLGFFLNLRAF